MTDDEAAFATNLPLRCCLRHKKTFSDLLFLQHLQKLALKPKGKHGRNNFAGARGGGGADVQAPQMAQMDYNHAGHNNININNNNDDVTAAWSHRRRCCCCVAVRRGDHTARRRARRLVPADIWTGCRLMCCFTLFILGGEGPVWTERSGTTSLVADPDRSGAVGTGGAGPAPPTPPTPILNPQTACREFIRIIFSIDSSKNRVSNMFRQLQQHGSNAKVHPLFYLRATHSLRRRGADGGPRGLVSSAGLSGEDSVQIRRILVWVPTQSLNLGCRQRSFFGFPTSAAPLPVGPVWTARTACSSPRTFVLLWEQR